MANRFTCSNCGAQLYAEYLESDTHAYHCRKCGALTADAAIMASLPDQSLATYRGDSVDKAEAAWRADEARWRAAGFIAVAHAWADGPADFATLGLIGAVSGLTKAGTLTVTYERKG